MTWCRMSAAAKTADGCCIIRPWCALFELGWKFVRARRRFLQARVPLAGGWKRNRCKLVAFAQERGTGQILCATTASL